MRSVREAIDRLRNESNGQLLVSTQPQHEDEQQETPKSRDPALFYAIAAQNWEQAARLVDAGIGLEYRKLNGCTVLHCAVQKDSVPIGFVRKLIQAGADPNARDYLALNTPLHYAVRDCASVEVVKLLTEFGSAVDAEAKANITPLMFACDVDAKYDVVKLLLDRGANPNRRRQDNFNQYTVLHWAVIRNASPALVQLLLENGGNPNTKDIQGKTAVHLAAHPEVNTQLFRLLLKYGGEFNNDRLLWKAIKAHSNRKLASLLYQIQILFVLCTPGSINRSRSSNNSNNKPACPLRILPTDVLRSLADMMF